ncbi:MAG: superoxide dismutase [Muribaculaceae bacterium]|nr:superoxide dismutase [Muribaculaceae bacterium]MDE6683298.1 superoxide dismutase [Muribaculaceae bacterium]
MKFTQPRLPYSVDALSPVISPTTIDYHYGKHEKAYIDTLNKLIEGTEFEEMSLEDIIRKSEGKLFNQASQAWNHILYFFQFSPTGKREPIGNLRDKIDEQFGSFDDFKKKFEEAGLSLFGSGWVWLSADSDGKLFITQGSNAENPLTKGLRPIFVFDVWEHAYYLDYQNRRGEYLSKLWDIVDWNIIERRYEGEE